MIRFLKKTVLPIIFACIMVLSVGCNDKENNNNDNNNESGNPPVGYQLNSAEAVNILGSLKGEIDNFVVKMNNNNVLDNENFASNMIPSVITLLNDSYKATNFCALFEEDTFIANKIYAHKTTSVDKFANVTTSNNEKLSVDLVTYASVAIEGSNCELFENYSYEIFVDEGDIKSLKVRNLIANDKIPSMNDTSNITMYELLFDFENETLNIFYGKPSKHIGWMLNGEYLDYYFDEDKLSSVIWGTLYTTKIDLKAQESNIVVTERYIDEINESLKNSVLDFSYTDFAANLTTLAASEEYVEIEDLFANIVNESYISYDEVNNKFAINA